MKSTLETLELFKVRNRLSDRELAPLIGTTAGLLSNWRVGRNLPFKKKRAAVLEFLKKNRAIGQNAVWINSYGCLDNRLFKALDNYMMIKRLSKLAFARFLGISGPALHSVLKQLKANNWNETRFIIDKLEKGLGMKLRDFIKAYGRDDLVPEPMEGIKGVNDKIRPYSPHPEPISHVGRPLEVPPVINAIRKNASPVQLSSYSETKVRDKKRIIKEARKMLNTLFLEILSKLEDD